MDFTSIKNHVSGLKNGAGTIAKTVYADVKSIHAAAKGEKVTNTITLAKCLAKDMAIDTMIAGVTVARVTCAGIKIGSAKVHNMAERGEERCFNVDVNLAKIHDEVVAEASAILCPISSPVVLDNLETEVLEQGNALIDLVKNNPGLDAEQLRAMAIEQGIPVPAA